MEENRVTRDSHGSVGAFGSKWLRELARELNRSEERQEAAAGAVPTELKRKPLSLRFAQVLNLLNLPLFWSGIIFIIWLLADFAMRIALAPADYQSIARLSEPVVAIVGPAIVGYWTNWLAIKMLFHPRRNNAVWWGLIPARRDDLVQSLSEGILQNLFSPEIVRDYLSATGMLPRFVNDLSRATGAVARRDEFRAELKELIDRMVSDLVASEEVKQAVSRAVAAKIDSWKGDALTGKMLEWTKGVWGPRVQREVVSALPQMVNAMDGVHARIDRLLDRIPQAVLAESAGIEAAVVGMAEEGLRTIDVRTIVRTQLDKMNEEELEVLLTGNVSAELVFIQTSGGIFGAAVGLAIMYPILRPLLFALGAGLYAVYHLTVQKPAKSQMN